MPNTAAIAPAFATFGDLLRYLRRRARLQQRDLAIAVGYSEGQVCRLELNQRLPDLTILAARFVPALDLEGEPELVARLLELAAAARNPGPSVRHDAAGKAGKRAEAPAAAELPRLEPRPGNLPTPLTPLINRTREAAEVCACLERPDVRLLTLLGPPGIGKTRLGLHVAAEQRALFADGVFFVALAPIRDAALVLPQVAHTLGIKENSDRSPIDALRAALGQRRVLLVLDNFEQVVAAAPQVAELLCAAPHAKALVTSRAALHLSGEHLFVVPPLELPNPRELPPLDQLANIPAIDLFTSRVRAIKPDFELTADNARVVAAICACLEGLPLAIELAAARSRLFSPPALLDRLRGASGSTTLQFLVGGPRDLLVHQQTLRGTIDWSYDLLDAGERALLMQLAVFVGGCTDEAVEAICGDCRLQIADRRLEDAAQSAIGNLQSTVLDTIWSLVDKSLLKCEIALDEMPRFSMLEIIREYAREKLDASGHAQAVRQRHAAYYLELARAVEREPSSVRRERGFVRLDAEYNNLRAALEWYVVHDQDGGLRLASSLRQFWYGRGYLKEGRSWLESILWRCHHTVPDAVRARALCVASFLAYQQGDLPPADLLAEESLKLYRGLGDNRGIADALCNLAGAAFMRNEYARAAMLFGECLALYRELGDRAEVALVLKNLGLIAKDRGDFARATAFYQESLTIRRDLGDERGEAQAFFNLGVVAYWQGDYTRAIGLTEKGLAIYRALGDKMGAAYTLETLGMAVYKQGDRERAMCLLEESLALFRDLGDQSGIALMLNDMGIVAEAQGDAERSARLHGEGLALSWKIGDKRRVAFCMEGLAMAAGPRQPSRAARLFGAAETLRAAIGAPLPPAERDGYERGVAAARAGDPEAFAAAWAEGRAMALEPAVAYALAIAPFPPRPAPHR